MATHIEQVAAERPQLQKTPRKAAAAAFVGSAMEYYDFFIYGYAAALVFSHLFFPQGDPVVATVGALATFGIGYFARPLGGIVLGHIGDRIGRKKSLVLSLVIMGFASTAIGLLPTYEQVGILAPILLTVCRLAQGFSAGGESAGASTLSLEHAPERRRAFFNSFVMSGYAFGMVFATLVFIPITALPEEDLYSWGWRVPFLCSVVVLVVGYIVRARLNEGPEYVQAKEESAPEPIPLVTVVRHHWRTVLRVFFVTFYAAMNTLISVFVISYATGASVGMERSELLMMNAAGIGASIVTIPLFAMLADRIGRRPVFLTGIIGATGSIYLIFWAITNGDWVLTFVGLFLNQAIFQGCFNGVWTVFFCEMFPTKIRYTGFALGNQIGLILVGFTPAIVGLLVPAGSTHWMPAAIYITVLLAISGIGIATARETHRVATHDLGKRGARASL